MRLKTKEYRKIMDQKKLTPEQICMSTGLSLHSLNWILDNGGFTSGNTIQSLAIAVGVEFGDIVRPESSDCQENGIEFIKDSKTATVQISQVRFKNRIKRLSKSHPEDCQILTENSDGTILANIPVEWVKISPPKKFTEEQKRHMAEILNRK